MRNLASVQIVKAVNPILGADAIECVDILGWKCVTKKGEVKVNDPVVYIEIDSLLPRAPWNEFFFKPGRDDGATSYRLRTVKLRGQVSQGLVLPLNILGADVHTFVEGQDITELLGIVKYEPAISPQLAGMVKGPFPSYIPKTDETRVQAEPGVLDEVRGKPVVITLKMDGSSGTFFQYQNGFGVCSRNLEFKEDGDNTFWKVANRYNLKDGFAKLVRNLAVQAELCGPGIQKNRLNLKDHDIYGFNAYDIQTAKYLDFDEALDIFTFLGIPSVPLIYNGIFDPSWGIAELLEMAKGKYDGTQNHREGIVTRPIEETHSPILKGRLSFKIINQDYLLKYEDA